VVRFARVPHSWRVVESWRPHSSIACAVFTQPPRSQTHRKPRHPQKTKHMSAIRRTPIIARTPAIEAILNGEAVADIPNVAVPHRAAPLHPDVTVLATASNGHRFYTPTAITVVQQAKFRYVPIVLREEKTDKDFRGVSILSKEAQQSWLHLTGVAYPEAVPAPDEASDSAADSTTGSTSRKRRRRDVLLWRSVGDWLRLDPRNSNLILAVPDDEDLPTVQRSGRHKVVPQTQKSAGVSAPATAITKPTAPSSSLSQPAGAAPSAEAAAINSICREYMRRHLGTSLPLTDVIRCLAKLAPGFDRVRSMEKAQQKAWLDGIQPIIRSCLERNAAQIESQMVVFPAALPPSAG
jgi:hypothetical protein